MQDSIGVRYNMLDFDLNKSMQSAKKEVEAWPDWMKNAMGITIKKKTKKQESDAALKAFLKGFADYMDNHYEVGKHSKELDTIAKRIKNRDKE